MYLELSEELIKKISNATGVDYENKGNLLPVESVEFMLKDLLDELDKSYEEFEDYKNVIYENYRPLTNKELYGDYEDYRRERGE